MAGKGKIIREALEGLSDTAQRWFNSLGEGESEPELKFSLNKDTQQWGWNLVKEPGVAIEELAAWPEFVEKLKNLDKEAPFVFSQYEPQVLRQALTEAAAGRESLAIMNPKEFKNLAMRGIEDWMQGGKYFHPDDPATKETYRKIQEYADMYESGHQFDAIPHLKLDSKIYDDELGRWDVDPNFLQIIGHEGRHRMRGQERIGSDSSLVRILRPDWLDLKGTDAKKSVVGESSGEGDETKSFADIFKLLSAGGISAGSLGNLVDEDKL